MVKEKNCATKYLQIASQALYRLSTTWDMKGRKIDNGVLSEISSKIFNKGKKTGITTNITGSIINDYFY